MGKTYQEIINFIRNFFSKASRKAAILGLSGGIDSSLTCLLCSQALGPKNVYPIYMPYRPKLHPERPRVYRGGVEGLHPEPACSEPLGLSPSAVSSGRICSSRRPAESVEGPQKNLIIEDITPQINAFRKKHSRLSKIDLGNKMVRERMSILYYYARKLKGLVVGTSNKSEILLGYFTLHGDGAWDLAPLAHLYKTEVIQLAKHLGLPQEIISQNPTAGLWPGQTDEKELGFTYAQADKILKKYLGKYIPKLPKHPKIPNIPEKVVRKVISRVRANAFKLRYFPFSTTLLKPIHPE